MTEDTKQTVKSVAKLSTAVIVAAAGGIYIGTQQISPPAKTVTLKWDVNNPPGAVVTEVWSSTNLLNWSKYADVAGSNLTVPANNPAAFFIVRNRNVSTGELSDWSRR